MTNPLIELQRLGQSPWHDNIRRNLLTTGALKRMVDDGDITGLTSNPTIFEQAIAAGDDYDAQIRSLARQGKSVDEIFDALAIKDIGDAADVFAPVYHRTEGADGFVSIEVAPRYANDTARTIDEAHRLWSAVRKPNLMVKIPATAAGVPAIEECIADGLNINVTLIFGLDRYDAVMNAYLTGLARRRAAGKAIDRISSVASFFVSRVDTEVDKRLDAMLATAAPDQAEQLKQLKGRSAIANAKLAYLRFRKTFSTSRYVDLAAHGARLQRPLWASTSTKNLAYPDVYYVEALIAPDTVDTMPPATIVAYKDHGRPEVRIDRDLDGAVALMQRLADARIDMDNVTTKLEIDGVASFAKSYDSLIATVTAAARAAASSNGAGGARTASVKAKAAVKRKAAARRSGTTARARKTAVKRKTAAKRKTTQRKTTTTGRARKTSARTRASKTRVRATAGRKRTTGRARASATAQKTRRSSRGRTSAGRRRTRR
ncbi:MAG: transaldolase [Deltaproteobacteria bacterium]|nr:transaldolase [Deltaproteobacteria bacterium]